MVFIVRLKSNTKTYVTGLMHSYKYLEIPIVIIWSVVSWREQMFTAIYTLSMHQLWNG